MAVLAGLALCACLPQICPPPQASRESSSEGFAIVGQSWRTSFLYRPASCRDAPAPTTAMMRVEALDPGNLPFDVAVAEPVAVDGQSYRYELSFTPVRGGPHSVLVSFDPVEALFQQTLFVARDARAAQPTVTAQTPGAFCQRAQLTPLNGLLCTRTSGSVSLFRGGTELQTFPVGARFFIAPNAVWQVDATGTLTRLADSPTGPLVVSAGPLANPGGGASAFDDDNFVLVSGDRVSRFAADRDGGLAEVARNNFPSAMPPSGLEVRGVAWSADAGTVVVADGAARAHLRLEGGIIFSTPSWSPPGMLAASDGSGLWLTALGTGEFIHVPADPRVPSVSIAYLPPGTGYAEPVADRLILFAGDTQVAIPSVENGEAQLTLYLPPAGTVFSEAGPRWLYATNFNTHYFYALDP